MSAAAPVTAASLGIAEPVGTGRLRAPCVWYGGKGNMVTKLLPLVPSHDHYCEAYFGAGSLFWAKAPAKLETINDLDGGIICFLRTLRHPEQGPELIRRLELTPYSREEYNEARIEWEALQDPIERTCAWFIVARMSFSGRFAGGWSFSRTGSAGGRSEAINWRGAIADLPRHVERLLNAQIEHQDALAVIRNCDSSETFFYLDPPYPHGTRSYILYRHDCNDAHHAALLDLCLGLQGKVLLSTYPNALYEERLGSGGWRKLEWQTACYAAGRTRGTGILGEGTALAMQPRTEVAWMNYDPPGEGRDGQLLRLR